MRGLKITNYLGPVLFFGSIAAVAVISVITKGTFEDNIELGSKILELGANYVSLQGIWMLILLGVL